MCEIHDSSWELIEQHQYLINLVFPSLTLPSSPDREWAVWGQEASSGRGGEGWGSRASPRATLAPPRPPWPTQIPGAPLQPWRDAPSVPAPNGDVPPWQASLPWLSGPPAPLHAVGRSSRGPYAKPVHTGHWGPQSCIPTGEYWPF